VKVKIENLMTGDCCAKKRLSWRLHQRGDFRDREGEVMNDRESDGNASGEFLNELFSAFEDLETQSAGILQFLKGKGLATDEELAPYLKQAGDASEVRWRAERLRMDALLAAAIKEADEEFARKMDEHAQPQGKSNTQKEEGQRAAQQKPASNEGIDAPKADARKKDSAEQAQAPSSGSAENDGNGMKEAVVAKKEEVETNSEVPAAKAEPESGKKRSETSGNNTEDAA
jgi:hypothetical protein